MPASAGIGRRGDAGHQPVEGGEERPLQRVFLAADADRVDDVEAAAPLRDESRNRFRRVLQVRVHQHDGVAAAVGQPRLDRSLMAEIAREVDDADAAIGGGQLVEDSRALVRRAVVDKNDFIVARARRRRRADAPHQLGQGAGFVEHGQDHAQQRLRRRRPLQEDD